MLRLRLLRNKRCDVKTAMNIPLSDVLDDNNTIFYFIFYCYKKSYSEIAQICAKDTL